MKKIIALVLALIMTFSLGTVAFAEGEATTAPEVETTAPAEGTEEESAGDFDWLLDLPFWTVKGGAKVAKIALKLAKVVVKLGVIFGLIDANDIIGQIMELIQQANPEEAETTAPVEETTAPAAAAAV